MTSARPSWTGTIEFGGLSIGVQLVTACPDPETEFVSVHAADMGTLKQLKICSKCSAPVTSAEIASAVEVGKGDYALVTAEEMAALATPARGTVKLDQFPPAGSIRPVLYEKSYYVMPASDDDRAIYSLLRAALGRLERVGLGKIALRGRERIAAIATDGDSLLMMLYVLRMPAEVRAASLGSWITVVTAEDVRAATELIEATNRKAKIHASYVPNFALYRDEYSEKLHALTARKRGRTVGANAGDIGATLKASVARTKRQTRRLGLGI